jgi:hypothetical protein
MPQVILKTGFESDSRQEEILHEYFCDWPDCPNVAAHVVGFAREIRLVTAVCDEHAAILERRNRDDSIKR